MSGYPKPKKYIVKNKNKYIGDVNNVVARSGLEIKFMNRADNDPNILKWNSEEIRVPYYITTKDKNNKDILIDDKPHTYFVDFYIETSKGGKFLVEIKPDSQTRKPRNSKSKSPRVLLNEHLLFAKNDSKWRAATLFAQKYGWKFIILTEKDLK